jgi:hypothetical protein
MLNPAGRAISFSTTAMRSRIGGEFAANSLTVTPPPRPASFISWRARSRSAVRAGSGEYAA